VTLLEQAKKTRAQLRKARANARYWKGQYNVVSDSESRLWRAARTLYDAGDKTPEMWAVLKAAMDASGHAMLLDCITMIDPLDTSFVSALPKVKSAHLYHQWLLDDLKKPAPWQPYMDVALCWWYKLRNRFFTHRKTKGDI
jgi:hypothetical protein